MARRRSADAASSPATAPLIVVATLAFAGGMVVAVEPDAPAAQRFVDAWERGDAAAMYAELTPDAQEEYSLPHFRQIYDDAATQSTLADAQRRRRQRAGRRRGDPGQRANAPVRRTSTASLKLPLNDGKIEWAPNLVYPGLAPGEQLDPAHQGAAARGDPRRRPQPARLGARRRRAPSAPRRSPSSARSGPRVGRRPRSWRNSASRPARSPGPPGWSSPSTTGSPAVQGASCSPPAART